MTFPYLELHQLLTRVLMATISTLFLYTVPRTARQLLTWLSYYLDAREITEVVGQAFADGGGDLVEELG